MKSGKLKKDGTPSRQGEGGGQPLKYRTEKEIIAKLLGYFRNCEKGKEMPNKAGLCLFLGISRPVYNDYKKRYPNALKSAEDTIENAWVQRLAKMSPAGAIFYLKNAFKEYYKDRQETDITTLGEKITGMVIVSPNGNKSKAPSKAV